MSFQMKHNSQQSSGPSFPLLDLEVLVEVVANVPKKGNVVDAVVIAPNVLHAVMTWFAIILAGLLVKGCVWYRKSKKSAGIGLAV